MKRFSDTRGLVIGASSSGTGKTTIASAICRILTDRGLAVQPFKTGPDFVDPTYLTEASGRQCRNLDGFPSPDLMPFFYAEGCHARRAIPAADIAVIEGVMGMYDGLGAEGLYSTAWISRTLDLPAVLLVDARASATSVAAVAKGFASLAPLAPDIAGVIANRVSGASHAELIGEALMRFAGIPLIGWIPNIRDASHPSRHLGLIPAQERSDSALVTERFTRALAEHLDVQKLLDIARYPSGDPRAPDIPPPVSKPDGSSVRVAVADDNAFCFHYRENWELLEKLGAEVTAVSPMNDDSVRDGTDLLILPGGYPEEFAGELSANAKFIDSARSFAGTGCVYAECGGMLYLSRSIEYLGKTNAMAGLIPADAKMTDRLQRFGYVEGAALGDSLFIGKGETVRAHEFHYSMLEGGFPNAFSVRKASRCGERWTDGFVINDGRLLATYLHVNFYSRPESARGMLARAAKPENPAAG